MKRIDITITFTAQEATLLELAAQLAPVIADPAQHLKTLMLHHAGSTVQSFKNGVLLNFHAPTGPSPQDAINRAEHKVSRARAALHKAVDELNGLRAMRLPTRVTPIEDDQ